MLQLMGSEFKVTETERMYILVSDIGLTVISLENVFASETEQRLKWDKKWVDKNRASEAKFGSCECV